MKWIATLLSVAYLTASSSGFVNPRAFGQRSTTTHLNAEADVNPRLLVSRGMNTFREGNVEESIQMFDRADNAAPDGSLRPFLWQRGISYYYADRFKEGSDQFRFDVRVNPLDVEEIVWDIACLSRLDPENIPPPSMMSLPKGRKDRRRIMASLNTLWCYVLSLSFYP